MEFIEESYGIDAIRAMLTGFGEIMTMEKVLAEVLGVTTDAFDTAFDGYLRSRFATGLNAVAADESDFESLWRAGADNLAAGNLDAAVSALEAAKDLFPGFAAANSPVHLLAQAYRRHGDRLAAIHELNTIVEIDADNLEAHHELAVLYLEEGNSSAAAGILERSRYINPFDMEIRQQLAGIYETNGEWERARGERAAIARLEPLDPAAAHFRHARALARTNHHAAARRELLRALEMAPLYDEALELLLEVRTALDPSDDEEGTASSLERAEQAE
jgi:tetratricopeptide (TPR) repeat protein